MGGGAELFVWETHELQRGKTGLVASLDTAPEETMSLLRVVLLHHVFILWAVISSCFSIETDMNELYWSLIDGIVLQIEEHLVQWTQHSCQNSI